MPIMDNPIKNILTKLDGHISLGLQYYLRHHLETWFERDQQQRDWYTNVEVLNEARRLAPYFGGVLQQYVELREDDDYSQVPANLTKLVTCLSYRQEPSEMLIRYAASPNLWVGMRFDNESLLIACRRGSVGYLKWFMTWNEFKVETAHLQEAILHDQLDMLKFLDQLEPINLTDSTINLTTVSKCSIETLNWLHERGLNGYITTAYGKALRMGRIDLVEWLVEKYGIDDIGPWYGRYLDVTIPSISWYWVYEKYHDKIDLTKLDSDNYNCNEDYLLRSDPERIAWYAERAKFSPNKLFRLACLYNKLPIAKWLQANYNLYKISKHNFRLFRQVCERGNLKIAQWMIETWPNINPRANHCEVFMTAYINKYHNIVKWYYQMWPDVVVKFCAKHPHIYIHGIH